MADPRSSWQIRTPEDSISSSNSNVDNVLPSSREELIPRRRPSRERIVSWINTVYRPIQPYFKAGLKRDVLGWSMAVMFGSALLVTVMFILLFLIEPILEDRAKGHVAINQPWRNQPKDGLNRWRTDFSRDVVPIMVHSHNDYWREQPLFSAIAAGCTGVEADVWLIDDELYVGHDRASLTAERTLKNLYIDPLMDILAHQNPDYPNTTFEIGPKVAPPRARGVFDTSPNTTLVLLIDIKTDASETWPVVLSQLKPLSDKRWLTWYGHVYPEPGFVERQDIWPGPVTVVGTGNLDRKTYFSHFGPDPHRSVTDYSFSFMDAPLGDLPTDNFWEQYPDGSTFGSYIWYPDSSYYASVSFKDAIGSVSFGFSEKQLAIVREQIAIARHSGLTTRYWDLPSWPIGLRDMVWDTLTREGVGMLSVDDLESAARRNWSSGYMASMIWMVGVSVVIGVMGIGIAFASYRFLKRVSKDARRGDILL